MNVAEMHPGKFLVAADLKKKAHKVIMDGLSQEKVGDTKENKWVLAFRGKDKGLVLNVTNTNMIAHYHGKETDDWTGKEIVIYPTTTSYAGKVVDCIRVKAEEPEPALETAPDDSDIPF